MFSITASFHVPAIIILEPGGLTLFFALTGFMIGTAEQQRAAAAVSTHSFRLAFTLTSLAERSSTILLQFYLNLDTLYRVYNLFVFEILLVSHTN